MARCGQSVTTIATLATLSHVSTARPWGPVRWVSGAVTPMVAGDAVGRSAYDVEGDKMRSAHVVKDSDVLRPARRRKYRQVGNEVIDASTCSAPQEGSLAERLMSCAQDDGNLAPAGVDHCFGAADTYSVRRDGAPSAVKHELPGRWQTHDCQGYDGH